MISFPPPASPADSLRRLVRGPARGWLLDGTRPRRVIGATQCHGCKMNFSFIDFSKSTPPDSLFHSLGPPAVCPRCESKAFPGLPPRPRGAEVDLLNGALAG